MSRSNYSDEVEHNWAFICWRGAVNSAIKGERGQKLLKELAEGMDAMPVKELIAGELETREGALCALGVVGKRRGIDMSKIDPECSEQVAKEFDIADALAREIVFINDEEWPFLRDRGESPGDRWSRVRAWVNSKIKDKVA